MDHQADTEMRGTRVAVEW